MSAQYDRYGDYIVDRRQSLGSGTFGTVWRGYRIIKGNEGEEDYLQSVAIKESAYDQKNIQEISTLQILTHPNIIQYIDYKVSKDNLFLVMQLCEGGTLQDLLLTFDEKEDLTDQVIFYYSQIVSGIKFMYQKNILHRDIKPSNILLKENKIKIADFGTSKMKQENQMIRTLVGTPLFASPEILELSVGNNQSYTEKSDIWSLGLILYFMFHYQKHHESSLKRLRESLPWRGKNDQDVLNNIKTTPLQFHCQQMPEQIKEIVKKMLTVDVEERMSFKEFFQIKLFQQTPKKKYKTENKPNMNQSIVQLQFSQTYNYNQYQLTLLNECTRQPQFIKRETVDFQLLKLLQIRDTEDHQEREVNDALKFYQLLRQQAEECNEKFVYNDLLFEIDCQLYQLLQLKRFFIRRFYSSHRGIGKSTHIMHKNSILEMFSTQGQPEQENQLHSFIKAKAISEKHFALSQRFTNLNVALRGHCQQFLNTSNIVEKEKLIMKLIVPNESLLQEVKIVLKNKRAFLFENREKLNAAMPKTQIYLVYDLLNGLAFDYCFKLKRQDKKKSRDDYFGWYREERNKINIWQIINRVLLAYQNIKI